MRNWVSIAVVLLLVSLVSCAKPINRAGQGAVVGGALGAGTGAIIGSASGRAGAGTAIGGGLGALGGALLGNSLDQQEVERERIEEEQRRQQEEIMRQRREIEDLRRQQHMDLYERRY